MLLYIVDQVIGEILNYFYMNEKSGLHYRTTTAMEKTTADVLVFGSSRANHHYVPPVFEDSLRVSFYNAGRDGQGILYYAAVLKSVLKRYTPKLIVLDINTTELSLTPSKYESLSSLLPYYDKHPEIRDIVRRRSKHEKWKLISKIYPYNSMLLTIVLGNMEMNKKRKTDMQGYVPLYGCWTEPVDSVVGNADVDIDKYAFSLLDEILNGAIKEKFKIVCVVSPVFERVGRSQSVDVVSRLCKEKGILFYSYLNHPLFFDHPDWFQDKIHLNDEGARVFSKLLVSDLKKQGYLQ